MSLRKVGNAWNPPNEVDNIDPFSERFRKYHNNVLYPTSYGDHMDRAIKSLGKDLSLPVSVDLLNTQAIKVCVCGHSNALEGTNQVHSVNR